ncbi:MAG: MFS family permease [Gammaproteobacteria bacterium]|jgi:MFS family permease
MSSPTPPGHLEPHSLADLIWPIGAMFGTQTVTVILFLTVPVMATEIAPVFGVQAKDISVFMSIVFGSAMVFSAASGSLIRRFGGIRANQIGMSVSALCLLLALNGSLSMLYLAAVLVGMGYGPNTPSGAHVLARVTPARARGFVFSLKQSGAPLGGLVAGLLVPAMVLSVGWRGAIVVSVGIAFFAVIAIQPLRAKLDDDRDPNSPLAFASPWHAIKRILNDTALRRLTITAFCLTSVQAIVLGFLMIILVQEVGLEFKLAGAVFGASQASGAVLRIAMGWVADKALGARRTLVVLGLGSAVALVSLNLLGPDSPLAMVIAISIVTGALSFGWNGVFLAEIVSLANPAEVGAATGGSLFFLYGGIVIGPILMSLLITLTGGFTIPLYGVALVTAMASLNLLRPHS